MPIWMIGLGIIFWIAVFWLGLAGQGRPKGERRAWNVALIIFVVMATGIAILAGYL